MRLTFHATTTTLWAAVAASITVAILENFSLFSLVLLTVAVVAICYWLLTHQSELRARYEAAEAMAAVPGVYDKQIWQYKPRLRDFAQGLMAMGFGTFYFAYIAAHGDKPTRIAGLIHYFLGVPGVVAFWAILGVIMLAKASEAIIGSRVKK